MQPLSASQDPVLNGHALVVDNEPGIRRLLSRILSRCGMKVTAVAGAAHAIEQLEATSDFSVLITDVEMAGPSGLDLARTARARGVHLPIVFITGCPETVVRFVLADGNAWYMGKPFTSREVASLLRSVLDGPPSHVRPVLEVRVESASPSQEEGSTT
jgi:CheY-like chemotaxis protein